MKQTHTVSIVHGVLEDLPLYLLIALYGGSALLLNRVLGTPGSVAWLGSLKTFLAFAIVYGIGASTVVLVHTVVVRRESLRRLRTWREISSILFSPAVLVSFGVLIFALAILMPTFIAFKQAIPAFRPFSWDTAFMEWDRWLHLGHHPFEWLQPVIGHPVVTNAIDSVYFLWIHVMWFTVMWQGWHGNRRNGSRSRYLLAFGMCWILLGTLLATLLSSAGPVYFAQVTGSPGPYTPLLDYLAATDAEYGLRAVMLHEILWTNYSAAEQAAFSGISAMPSLHISIAVLNAFLGFSVNRWLGWAYTTFALLIFVGSIHLAWHYAIDAYVSLVGTALIWFASGKVTRWWRAKLTRLSDT